MGCLARNNSFVPVVLHLNLELGTNSETCTGKIEFGVAHQPSLYKYGLVAVRQLEINGLCLDGRDRIGDVVNYLADSTKVFSTEIRLNMRGHVFSYRIVVVEDLYPVSLMGTSGNHELKKSIARIKDVARFGRSDRGEFVVNADVLAFPAVNNPLILGRKARHSGMIGSDNLLPG